jgi:hypothetical protein
MGRLLFFLLTFMTVLFLNKKIAGQTTVVGKVTELSTGIPIPFANVIKKGSLQGTVTDTSGVFILKGKFNESDSLRISAVGYIARTVAFSKDTLRVFLQWDTKQLGSVEIKAGENPAILLLRKVLARKLQNNPEYRDYYRCDSYSKVQIDFLNIPKTPPQKGMLKEFSFMWNNIDTTDSNRTRLPVFFSETAAEYYFRKNPRSVKEYVTGSKASGFQNPDVSRMITDADNKVNFYDEYLYIFNKNFPSPLNDNFKVTYRYYLDDSFYVDGVQHYLINFLPKNPADPAFSGFMIIQGEDYAVVEAHLSYTAGGNVNFIRSLDIKLHYTRTPEGIWFQDRQVFRADLSLLERNKEIPGVLITKTGIYTHPQFTPPADLRIFRGENKLEIPEEALERKDDFWESKRPEKLEKKEAGIYQSVDSLRKNSKFKILKGVMGAIAGGYIRAGKIDVGDVQTFFSWNQVEGPRVKLGFRTNRFLTKKFFSKYWAAYGFRDRMFKGGFEASYYPMGIFGRRHHVGVKAMSDILQIGMSDNAMPLDNVFTSISRTSPLTRLTLVREGIIHYEHDWFDGFVTRLSFIYRQVIPRGGFVFTEIHGDGTTNNLREITNTELKFNTRFAYKDRRLSAIFTRRIFVNKYPVISFEAAKGFKGVFGSDYNYWRVKLSVSHRQKMGRLGYMDYMLEGGKIWGNLPYHLLEVHNGNQTFINDDAAFNTMRFFEFVSDRYVSLHVENHFEGFFFNRIPIFKKLKWREFLVNKVLVGGLSAQNRSGPLVYPEGLSALRQPFWETGFGIENIFKVVRVDFLWRVGPIDTPGVRRFHIKPSLYLRF